MPAERGILVKRTVLEVKKLKVAIFAVAMLAVLVGCGDENKTVDATPTPEQMETQALPDVLNDDALITCASAALSEIGVSDAEFLVSSDTNDGVTHDVNLETTHEGTPLTVSCFSVDGEWYVTSIYSEETKKFYWADDDVRVFQDIYDLKTGELISAKSKEIEDAQKELEERAGKIVDDAKDKISSLDGGA